MQTKKEIDKSIQLRKIQMHEDICITLHKLYIEKNSDYGDSVSHTYKKYGIVSFLTRMEDKLNRLNNLREKDSLVAETIDETLQDLANYAILAIIELREDKP